MLITYNLTIIIITTPNISCIATELSHSHTSLHIYDKLFLLAILKHSILLLIKLTLNMFSFLCIVSYIYIFVTNIVCMNETDSVCRVSAVLTGRPSSGTPMRPKSCCCLSFQMPLFTIAAETTLVPNYPHKRHSYFHTHIYSVLMDTEEEEEAILYILNNNLVLK